MDNKSPELEVGSCYVGRVEDDIANGVLTKTASGFMQTQDRATFRRYREIPYESIFDKTPPKQILLGTIVEKYCANNPPCKTVCHEQCEIECDCVCKEHPPHEVLDIESLKKLIGSDTIKIRDLFP